MTPIEKYAPLLLFHRAECHFPGRPKEFQENARFRMSNFKGRKDRGWNKTRMQWETNNNDGPDYRGTEWDVIDTQIKRFTREVRPGGATPDGRVTRPRDDRNLWSSEDKTRGFFLDLAGWFGIGGSGCDPGNPAPIFHDVRRFTVDNIPYVAVLYWFFYIQNWNVIYTHEGDWEHMTLYFRENDFDDGLEPIWMYFASHENGHFFRWTDERIVLEDHTHPHVYICPLGHPSYPTVPEILRKGYTHRIRTWNHAIPSIEDRPWYKYCGAWGKVGPKAWMTGPLGPYFKRNIDVQKIKRRILRAKGGKTHELGRGPHQE